MTAIASNLKIKAKVEVLGIKSYQQILPVDITSAFIAGETVVGTNSGATAECVDAVGIGTGLFMVISQRDGEFDFNEPITGSTAGIGETTGSRISGDQDYTNQSLGISSGLWTIESTGSLGISFDDSVKRINIAEGGNFGTGYTFGFTLKNFDLVKQIIEDGVFLQNLKVKYYIDFGDGGGYEQVWGGILDTFPKSGSTKAVFKCKDSMKLNSNKIGSEKTPICLNRNYNCKLPLESESITEFNFIDDEKYTYAIKVNGYALLDEKFVKNVEESRNSIVFAVLTGSPWINALNTYNGLRLIAASGDGLGEYTILGFSEAYSGSTFTYYNFTLDKSVSDITDSLNAYDASLTMFKLVLYDNTYNISENNVLSVHEEDGTFTKGLKAIDNETEAPLHYPLNYDHTNFALSVRGIGENKKITSHRSISIDSSNITYTQQPVEGSYQIDASFQIDIDDLINISDNGDDDSYLIINDIELTNIIASGTATSDLIVKTDRYEIRGSYKNSIIEATPVYYAKILPATLREVAYDVTNDGSSVFITPVMSGKELKVKGFSDFTMFSTVNLFIRLRLEYDGISFQNGSPSFEDFDLRSYSEYSIDNLSIGTNGENVDPGNQFENYPDTIKYIDTTFNGVDISDINTASYDQAQADYELFNSTMERNPAHQITEQTDFNEILGDMLYFSHLGLFPDRFDKRTLVNWLPKSAVFSDSTPTTVYTKFLGTPEDIERPRNTKIASDYELIFNLNEATGDYLNTIRIKNTNESSFDFDRDTEGIPLILESEAFEVWDQLASGEKRIKKQSKTTVNSKWIKAGFPDNTGVTEALTFIRNQASHVNREMEYKKFSVPLNKADAIKELLSFDSVNHPTKTDGQERPGWIVEHTVSFTASRVRFKLLLDINKKDPFFKRFNIIQDNATEDDIIEDNTVATDIIQDGTGY